MVHLKFGKSLITYNKNGLNHIYYEIIINDAIDMSNETFENNNTTPIFMGSRVYP